MENTVINGIEVRQVEDLGKVEFGFFRDGKRVRTSTALFGKYYDPHKITSVDSLEDGIALLKAEEAHFKGVREFYTKYPNAL